MSPAATPIPILLVADRVETCERIASAMLSAPALYRVERVSSAELAASGPPADAELALVDGYLRAIKPAQVVTQLNAAGLPVVAMVDTNDVQTLQEVVLAGAGALVAVPFADKQLWETVGAALARGPKAGTGEARAEGHSVGRASEGLVIALYGPKGGSGTSMLAGNLAVSLQQTTGKRAVLVEVGEDSGSQAVLLNLHTDRTLADLLARFDPDDIELLNSVLATHSSGVRVLLAPATPGTRVLPDLLDEVIAVLRHMFEFVVIDVDSGSRPNAMSLLRKAHALLLVVTPEMTSLQQARVFVEAADANLPDLMPNIVLNRSTLSGGVPADAIRRHLRMQIGAQIPDDQPLITSSVNRGVPVVESHPRSAVARAIEKLARDLVPAETTSVVNRVGPAPSPFARLIPRGRPA